MFPTSLFTSWFSSPPHVKKNFLSFPLFFPSFRSRFAGLGSRAIPRKNGARHKTKKGGTVFYTFFLWPLPLPPSLSLSLYGAPVLLSLPRTEGEKKVERRRLMCSRIESGKWAALREEKEERQSFSISAAGLHKEIGSQLQAHSVSISI